MLNRRNFLKNAGAAGLAAGPFLKFTSRAASPNDAINIAVIGIRSRGAAHYKQFAKLPNVNVVTLCDVDERLFAKALKDLGGEQKIKTETDLRRVLDDKVGGRRLDRHAGSLARARHDLGLPGWQRRLRREARVAHHLGRS